MRRRTCLVSVFSVVGFDSSFEEGFLRLFPDFFIDRREFLTSWISASLQLSVAKAITILIRKLQELSSEIRSCSSDHQTFYKQVRMVNFLDICKRRS
ncbi:unnamed protein product [Sphagnum troendelagicum]